MTRFLSKNGSAFRAWTPVWLGLIGFILTPFAGWAGGSFQTVPGHVPKAVAAVQPVDRLPATRELRLAIGLPLRNRADLTNLLQRLYDPASADYHQFLTPGQFTEQFGPDANDYQSLSNFVVTNGLKIACTHSNRVLLDVTGSVAAIEKLLHVTLRVYPHPREPRTFFAPDTEPTLALATPVLHISGLDDYLRPRPMNLFSAPVNTSGKRPALGSGPGGSYLGNDFRAAYVPGTTLTGAGQTVGLLEFDGYYAADVAAYRHEAAQTSVPLKTILLDGFNGLPGANNTEVSLDIDMATCMAPGLNAILVYEGEVPDDILSRMATDNLAKQLSASWLYPIDPDTEQIFMQMAAQGQSFFNAAGDYDAYVGAVDTPADDPNITIVGGTTLQTSAAGGSYASETVWNWNDGTGTGGGISTTYPIPVWQQGVNMSSNQGSTNMRNLPDVALIADNVWLIYDDGASGIFGGTSCATPLWAAFTALVNQQALANGKPPQGFINPAVYALGLGSNYASAFHDITVGNNTSYLSPTNYYAVRGYDLCTGWGTPNGANLINLLAPPDNLQIYPATGFSASGGAGGPFPGAGQIFVLTNTGAATLKWAAGGGAPWLAISATNGTLSAGGAAAIVTVTLNAAASNQVVGAYSATVYFTNLTDGFAQSRAFTLNIINPPTITQAPGSQAVLAGSTVRLAGSAIGGSPLFYQWQLSGANLADGGNISGSLSTALTITNVAVSNVGLYTIVASNAAGAVTSAPPALLSIIPSSPVITIQPASQYALAGTTATLSVTAEGDAPLNYQWLCNGTNLVDGGTVFGSATSALTLGPAAASNSGAYTVLVTNHLGSELSAPAVFSVYALSDTELIQNGGFETGDFTDWNATGNSSLDTVSGDALYTHSGLYGAEMGPIGAPGYISQTVPTIPGTAYLLSLWLDSPDGDGPNEFIVSWNGYTILDMTNLTGFGWSNFVFSVTATTASTTVELGFRDDTSFLGLDDVQCETVVDRRRRAGHHRPAGGADLCCRGQQCLPHRLGAGPANARLSMAIEQHPAFWRHQCDTRLSKRFGQSSRPLQCDCQQQPRRRRQFQCRAHRHPGQCGAGDV